MGPTQPVLRIAFAVLGGALVVTTGSTFAANTAEADLEIYRALTAALSRAEFGAVDPLVDALTGPRHDESIAKKAEYLRHAARFLEGSEGPPAQSGVVASAGALQLSLANDLAFAATTTASRGMHPILFGHPAPFTSRVTLRVDDEDLAISPRAVLGSGPGVVQGRATERDVEVVLTVAGGGAPSWHPAADVPFVRIQCVVTNRGASPRKIGARLLLDLCDGFDDAPALHQGDAPTLSVATDYVGDAVPRRLSFGPLSVVMRGIGAPAPERALVVPLRLALDKPFDFALDQDVPLGGDSALLLYADPRVLAPGESRVLEAHIGGDADDLDREQPLRSALFTEPVAGDPLATRVVLAMEAGAKGTLGEVDGVRVTPRIAAGLRVLSSAKDFARIGSVARGMPLQRSLVVRPDQTRGGALEVAFDIDGRFGTKTLSRRVATAIGVPSAVHVAGRIVDLRGRAVPNCEIVLKQAGRDVARGVSDGAGNYRFDGLAPGEYEVAAKKLVFEQPAVKAAHEDVDGLMYDVFLLSETIDDAGHPVLPKVTPGDGRDVLLARSLTRYCLLVGVEWDAPREYLEGLARGMRRAAEFLYAASDGQFTFGRVAIHDCGRDWMSIDLWDWANNSVHPNATVAGIHERFDPVYHPWNTGINFGRQWAGAWDQLGLFSTVCHEFGHYGFGLYDEYLGAPQGVERGLSYPEMCRCIMGYQYSDHKICFAKNHRAYTNQGMWNGRSCWEQLKANHEGDRNGFYVPITTPAERGGVTPPPVANHIGDELKIVVRDDSTAGHDARLEVVGPFGRAPPGIPVYTEMVHEARTVYMGITLGDGALTLMGIHPGDKVFATFNGARAELVLDERKIQPFSLEFGSEPREGRRPPLSTFVPDEARGAFAGGALEIEDRDEKGRPRSKPAVTRLDATHKQLPVIAIDETAGRFVAQADAASFAGGRGAFEIVSSDAIGGDVTTLVDVTIGRSALAAFDGSLEVHSDPSGQNKDAILAVASAAGPPWVEALGEGGSAAPTGTGSTVESIGRIHAIASGRALGTPVEVVVRPLGNELVAGAIPELRILDPSSGRFVPPPPTLGVVVEPNGDRHFVSNLPLTVAWFVRR